MSTMPQLTPKQGWSDDQDLPCCGCGVPLRRLDYVQVDFFDNVFMLFCGFKCLALWTRYFTEQMGALRAWTDLIEPRTTEEE